MARRPPPQPQPASLNVEQMQRGIATLSKRIAELEKFDPETATETDVEAIQQALSESIERVFRNGTSDWTRYNSAAHLDNGPISFGGFGRPAPRDTRRYLTEGKASSLVKLTKAIEALQERIEEAGPQSSPSPVPSTVETIDRSRVFIVHGHDGEPKHEVARFLMTLGLEPVILSEQADEGMTIIEKFEKHSDVGFAVVLLTPDDEGALSGQSPKPRARQNVVFELGFFAGKLGRKYVHAIVRGSDLELPSDIDGVIWSRYEDDWKLRLARELKVAGYAIDMNKAF